MYITDSAALASFCADAASSKVIAVDTEFVREKTYYPKLCLIQVATEDAVAAIDPMVLRDDDMAPLASMLSNPVITKVFHACAQDLEVLNDRFGSVPSPVFDTQLAAAFLGHRIQLGYGTLVDVFCGVRLPKADSLTDWTRRPLDAAQLRYAEDDVVYLPRIYEQMTAELILRDRLAWLEPEMAELTRPERFRRDPRTAFIHLRRVSSLTRKQLAIAREVCDWRERLAASRNLPRKWLVSDEVVIAICQRAPKTTDSLRRIRGTEQLSETDARGAVDAVRAALSCDPNSYPSFGHRRERPSGEAESVLDLMYALLHLIAEKNHLAPQLIASRDDLYDFLRAKHDARLSSGWRWELAGEPLRRLLEGEIGLTVKDGRVEQL